MKKKLMSMLLTMCLVVGLLPMSAMAEGPIKVGEATFATIEDAVKNDAAADIEVVGDYTLSKADLKKEVAEKVQKITLKSGKFDITKLNGSNEVIESLKFPVIVKPEAQLTILGEPWYGSNGSRIELLSGEIILSDLDKATIGKSKIQIKGAAKIPKGETAYTQMYQEGTKKYGAVFTVEGSLMVEGTLKAISGSIEEGSEVINRGSFIVSGELHYAKKADFNNSNPIVIEKDALLQVGNNKGTEYENPLQDKIDQFTFKDGALVGFAHPLKGEKQEADRLFKDYDYVNEDNMSQLFTIVGKKESPAPQQPTPNTGTSQSPVRPDSNKTETIKDNKTPKTEAPKNENKDQMEKMIIKLTIGQKAYTKEVKAVVTEHMMDVAPRLSQSRTMLPARMISESLGVEVKYDETTKTATFMYGENKAELTLGQKMMKVNGKDVALTAEVIVADGRILLPLTDVQKAFASLGLEATVTWDATTKMVTIEK